MICPVCNDTLGTNADCQDCMLYMECAEDALAEMEQENEQRED